MFYLEHANEKIICPDIDGFYPANVIPTVKWYLVRKTYSVICECSVVSEKAKAVIRIMELSFRASTVTKLLMKLL